ncbi:MAG: hypothetical protein A2Y13_07145 [Planctomycetes bacterium GWC2_45_44]|nr:MAG: hypothetical protein A2Y13_07145 [Planctomycetes bacterium GWC2_45_44]
MKLDSEIKISNYDMEILRAIASDVAEIAQLEVHRQKAALWTRLNDIDSMRPMVWINEICWHEMNVNNELTLYTQSPWAQNQETCLRQLLYQWRHLPADMIVSNYLSCPLVIHDTGFGVIEDVDIVKTDENNSVVSRCFRPQISKPSDIDKIKMPVITYDVHATNTNYQLMCQVYSGILPVKKEGIKHIWFTPWDNLIRWWGVQEAMMDLIARPNMVNDIVSRMVDSYLCGLEQFEKLNLLALHADDTRIGSGGYGCVSQLPGKDFSPDYVRPLNMWGCSNAQIFSGISPEMHWEFAIKHDIPWLKKWGLNYYGCCEPLDMKMDILKKIPNLRKVSMSPWINKARAAEAVGKDYVFSFKPNPAVLAETDWNPKIVRAEIKEMLEIGRSCHIEIILKDISTVRYQPRRLWEWCEIAMELACEYAS